MNLGIIHGEPMDVYQASPAVSGGKLRLFASNFPALYKARYIDKTVEDKDSAAFAFGRYFHALAIEGKEAADAAFVVAPGFDKRTKAGKESFAAFIGENMGREIVDQDDAFTALCMCASMRLNPDAVELLKQGSPEVTFRHNKIAEMPQQTRPDWYSAKPCALSGGYPYTVNLKTVDGLKENFAHQAHKYGYFLGEAFSRAVIADVMPANAPITRHFFVAVDKSEPFGCGVYEVDEITMDTARQHVTRQLKELLACIKSNDWPTGPVGVLALSAPEYWNAHSLE